MNFFSVIKKSVYGPDFYRSLKDQPLSFSVKYFYSLALVLSVIMCAIFSYIFLPKINLFFLNAKKNFIKEFPASLIINIEKGRASTNSKEPIYFPATEFAISEASFDKTHGKPFANFLVIDTKRPYSPELFVSYKTFVLLTSDSVVVSRGEGTEQVQSLKNVPAVKIDHDKLVSWVHEAESYLKILTPIVVFGFFVLFLVGYSLRLLELFIIALVIWTILRLGKVKLSYMKTYQIGIHAMTLGLLLWTIILLSGDIYVPLYFVIITVIIAVFNMLHGKSEAIESITNKTI